VHRDLTAGGRHAILLASRNERPHILRLRE
jgi:hypothetical protein